MKKSTKKAARTLTPARGEDVRADRAAAARQRGGAGLLGAARRSGNPLEITITKQRAGENAEAMLTLKRHDFERVVDWYNTGKWRRR
jgi:secreted protein with Ig-like and vWFA domain